MEISKSEKKELNQDIAELIAHNGVEQILDSIAHYFLKSITKADIYKQQRSIQAWSRIASEILKVKEDIEKFIKPEDREADDDVYNEIPKEYRDVIDDYF